MTTGERIKALRLQHGMTMEELAQKIGLQKAAIYKYESGLVVNLKRDVIEKLANVFGVSPSYIMCMEDEPQAPNIPGIIPMPKMHRIPLIGQIACGAPILAEEHIEGHVDAPENVRADFALTCKGDSMINARIYDGDIVYVRQQETVETGEIAAVLIDDNEATLKRVKIFSDHIVLEPENPAYRPMVYWDSDMENVRILGKAVAFTSAIR